MEDYIMNNDELKRTALLSGFEVIDDINYDIDLKASRFIPANINAIGARLNGDIINIIIDHIPSPFEFREYEQITGLAVTLSIAPEPIFSELKKKIATLEEAPRNIGAAMFETVKEKATDLHLSVGSPPIIRVKGELKNIDNWPPLTASDLEAAARWVAGDDFANKRDVDCAITYANARWRVSLYRQRQSLALALRRIPSQPPKAEELGLTEAIIDFTTLHSGLVLFCGPTGSGKSTSLAALVDRINKTRSCHILTLEDPIEYIHSSALAMVHQREVGVDVSDFASGLRSALRQDPDVLLVGELRDLETISTALSAAETGHLVLATVHASSTSGAITRIIDAFPAGQQAQIRAQLASSIQGIVAQKLIAGKNKRFLANEILVVTTAVRNMIRESKLHEIGSVLDNSSDKGMISMDKSLAWLVANGKIDSKSAIEHVANLEAYEQYLGRININSNDLLDPISDIRENI
jgi:twitching motility protein PilT